MIKYSVVIVDDHTLLSQAIATMVNTFSKFKVLYTCKNGQELVEKFSASAKYIPDIVLMDINMPIMNGIETTDWITKNHESVNVMALSVEDEDNTILKMLKVGAIGYLLKDTEKSVLEKCALRNCTKRILSYKNSNQFTNEISFGQFIRRNYAKRKRNYFYETRLF